MDLFELSASLRLDSQGYEQGLKNAESKTEGSASKIGAAFNSIKTGLFEEIGKRLLSIPTTLKNLVSEVSTAGDKIDKQSQALGVSRRAYQEWDYILGQSGASVENFGISMKTLQQAIRGGSGEAKEALDTIGLSAESLASMSQEGALEAVVRAFQKLPAGADKSAAAVKLFGRNGQQLLPLLNSSTTSIDEFRAQAEDLGLIMSDEAVDASVEYGDALDRLQRSFNGLKYNLGSKVLPVLTGGLEKLAKFVGRIHKRFEQFTIEWPSWDVVKFAAQKAWDKIREGALHLAGLVFGKKEDGSVNWPTWEDVKTAAKDAWDAIVETAGNLTNEFGTLVFGTDEKGEVKWPSWDDVREAAKQAWNTIVTTAGALGDEFGKIVFGTTETGEVKWPSWEDVTTAAKNAWDTIVEKASTLGEEFGKLIFGTTETGEVKWPSWDDVERAAQNAWDAIRLQAIKIADWAGGLVFGRSEDGSVRWPTWDDVLQAAGDAWAAIKEKAVQIADWAGGLIFGRNEDGSVAWPSWSDVANAAGDAWNEIKRSALAIADTLGGLVFGRAEDGSVAWPDVGKLATDFSDWWQNTALPAIEGAMSWTLTLFGMPKESADQIASTVGGWWGTVVDTVTSVLNWALHLPDSPHEAGAQLREIIDGWWQGVKGYAEGVLKWVLGLFGIGDAEGTATKESIQTWWDEKVVPFLGGILDFVLGLFGLPSVDDMVNKINTWWEDVKAKVGSLFLNIFPHLPENPSTVNDGGHGGGGHGFAKGLNYVPYDGFIATLHRGEQVLTASQARHQNDGGANVGVLAGVVEDLKATLTNLRIEVGEKEFGSTVADYGSSRVRKNISGFNRKRRMGYGSI